MGNRTAIEQNLLHIGVVNSEFDKLTSNAELTKLWLQRYKVSEIQKHEEKTGQLAKTGASSSTGR